MSINHMYVASLCIIIVIIYKGERLNAIQETSQLFNSKICSFFNPTYLIKT